MKKNKQHPKQVSINEIISASALIAENKQKKKDAEIVKKIILEYDFSGRHYLIKRLQESIINPSPDAK